MLTPLPFDHCPTCEFENHFCELRSYGRMYFYRCPHCGHEEAGTVNHAFPPPGSAMDTPKSEVLIGWRNGTACARELFALRKLDKHLHALSTAELKRRADATTGWSLGTFYRSTAEELAAKAAALGLVVTLRER